MDRLKEILIDSGGATEITVKDKVEVVGLTIKSCLRTASLHLKTDLSMLDYDIIERGKKSFLNLDPKPYRLLVSILPGQSRYADLEEFSKKLGVGDRLLDEGLERFERPKDVDGRILVRIYRAGTFLTVFPPEGDGIPADPDMAMMKISHHGVHDADLEKVKKIVKEASGEPVKIGPYIPRPDSDSTVKVDISADQMKATIRITPPRPGGRHLEVKDVVTALKAHGVVIGYMEDDINRALMDDVYMQEILAAKGQPPRHGADARIDYKVDVNREGRTFEEDASGKVDFKKMNLVENVVVGQILAEKLPAERGMPGRTLMNRLVEARDGKDLELKPGRNTILSDDGKKLIAEINGQVVYASGKMNVEPVYRVAGDVGPKTGNIMFLGSVVVSGNVLDNYEVKAAGNVEVNGSVQKARIEAEGDIVVFQGIMGRDEARIESTGGSLTARFIQSANVSVTGDVTVQEGILHSTVEAGGSILCNGRRAQIVGGHIRARKEVRARMIGSQAYTSTEVTVGVDPRILKQLEELRKMLKEAEDKFKKAEKSRKTLDARKAADPEAFTDDQENLLQETIQILQKQGDKVEEIKQELAKINEYVEKVGGEGRVHAEKDLYPGVLITIKDATQNIADTYSSVSLSYDKGYVKIGKLEKAEDGSRIGRRK